MPRPRATRHLPSDKPAKPPKEPAVIAPCAEAERIAFTLIAKHHSFLRDVPIVYLTTTAQRKSHGKVVHATTKRMTAPERYFFAAELPGQASVERFVVLIDAACWGRLKQHDREALIDEQLSALSLDDKDNKVIITGYDAQLFTANIQRFGPWNPDLKRAVEVLGQGRLDLAELGLADSTEQEQAAHAPQRFADEPVGVAVTPL